MGKYIDKDALVAEIESMVEKAKAERVLYPNTLLSAKDLLLLEDLEKILSFLDSLEVKEVDLEKELTDWLGDRVGKWTGEECENMCRYFFELGLKAQKGEKV